MDDLGAYGFRLRGLDEAARWMQPHPDRPFLQVDVVSAETNESPSNVDENAADISLIGGGRLRATRGEDVLRYELPHAPPAGDLLHPYLAPGAALAAKWSGLEALHAGAFGAGAGAVLLLGDKEAGKSTTLAWLARRARVVADDMIVIEDGHAIAGPRLIDVRAKAAEGDVVRDGTRVREQLDPIDIRTPLAGAIVLEWGDELEAAELAPAERIGLLAESRMFPLIEADPSAVLDLAGRPMYRLRRPRSLEALEPTGELLLNLFA